jgi:hypothetical protein
MAEANSNGQKLSIKTAFGEVSSSGGMVFIVIALVALGAIGVWEHYKRRQEFEQLDCQLSLNLFLQTKPRGEFAWNEIPTEYWRCLPASFAQKMKP